MGAMKCVAGPRDSRDTLWWPAAGGRDDIYSKLFYINICTARGFNRPSPRKGCAPGGESVMAAAVSVE